VNSGDGRAEVEQLLSAREFQYPTSLGERIGEWVGSGLEWLVDRLPGVDVPSGAFGGGVGAVVGWLLVALAVAAIVVVAVVAARRWVPRQPQPASAVSEVELEHRRTAREWADDAAALEAAGEWKLALRARYRELVRTLVDRSQVQDLAGRTPAELCTDVAHTTPGAAEDLAAATALFELPWYGAVPTGAEENARFRARAASVLAAPVEHPLDGVPTATAGRVSVDAGEQR
jgi:hypothetical protein